MSDIQTMEDAVSSSVRNGKLTKQDAGAVMLALKYARVIDGASPIELQGVMSDIGPKLLAVMTALGLSLAGRTKAPTKVGNDESVASARDEIADARDRRARKNGA